tara:strand:+ start:544 stop:942 length:399 start_codon:yes stop_codon:yes gene_type:complete
MSRVASENPDDDLTAQELLNKEAELQRKNRRMGISQSTLYRTNKQILSIASRMGKAPPQTRTLPISQNNITPNEYNRYVRERYTPLYPIRRDISNRGYDMVSSTGKTALEKGNRARRGNKKVVRRRRRKRKK